MESSVNGTLLDYTSPPECFQTKEKYMHPRQFGTEQGLFNGMVKTFTRFPCSLVLERVASRPVSNEAITMLEKFSSIIGPLDDGKKGFYGAGGGPIHIFYFGQSNNSGNQFPDLTELLEDVMDVSHDMLPPSYAWVSTVDVCHQHMFPRTACEVSFAGADLLRTVYDTLREAKEVYPLDLLFTDICQEQFPYLQEPYLLFVQPYFLYFHGGNCPPGCPRDSSMCVQIVGTFEADAADLGESPTFAFFKLITGEIMALCYWDYLG